jgi:hypothetical protein
MLTAMPAVHDAPHAVAGANGMLYVIGVKRTFDAEANRSLTHIYDPVADAWNAGNPAPALIAYGSAVSAAADGPIWTFGGTNILSYQSARSTWTPHSVPDGWGVSVDSAVHQDDGSVAILFGGAHGLWAYDPADGLTRQLAAPRIARYNAALARLPDGRLLVGGGYLAGSCIAPDPPSAPVPPAPTYQLFDVLDPGSGEWQSLSPLPLELTSVKPLIVGGSLFAVGLEEEWDYGGSDPARLKAELVVAKYTPAGETLEAHAPLPGAGGCGG